MTQMNTKFKSWSSLILISLAAAIWVTECSDLYNDIILDNREHGLSCAELPTVDEVNHIVAEHQEQVQQILDVSHEQVWFDVDSGTCPQHADIIISYSTNQHRRAIEAILGSDTFFGVPIRLRNM